MQNLLSAVLLLAVVNSVRGQVFGGGPCPTYQTSAQFSEDVVTRMVEDGQGMIPYLSSGTLAERYQTCQYLKLTDAEGFSYTYRDGNNDQHTITGTYTVVPTSFKQPGYLRLYTGQLGLLGSDLTGYVNLHPIVLDKDKEVYVACTSYGVFHAEFAYTFMKPGARRSGDVGDIQASLIKRGIPLAEEMGTVDQTCFEADAIMRRRVPQYVTNLRANGFKTILEKAEDELAEADEVNVEGQVDAAEPVESVQSVRANRRV